MTTRLLLGSAGLALAAYGGWLLLSRQDLEDLVEVGLWLVAVVVVHDAVLAPAVVAGGLLVGRLLPRVLRAPVAVAAVVLGSVTLLAVPVLGRFGAVAANPTLLDRDYRAGWLLLAGLTAVGVALGAALSSRRRVARSGAGG